MKKTVSAKKASKTAPKAVRRAVAPALALVTEVIPLQELPSNNRIPLFALKPKVTARAVFLHSYWRKIPKVMEHKDSDVVNPVFTVIPGPAIVVTATNRVKIKLSIDPTGRFLNVNDIGNIDFMVTADVVG